MKLMEIEQRMHTAKGYRAVCESQLKQLGKQRHTFDFDHQFYIDRMSQYDNIIDQLVDKRRRLIQKKLYGTLAVSHAFIIAFVVVAMQLF